MSGLLARAARRQAARSKSDHPRRSPLRGRNAVWWMGSTRRVAAFVNYIRSPVSERPAWGWTALAMVLTNSWSGPRDGEKTASGERCGGAVRRGKPDRRRKPETRKSRKHGQLRSCGRREALTGGWESLRKKIWLPMSNKGGRRDRDAGKVSDSERAAEIPVLFPSVQGEKCDRQKYGYSWDGSQTTPFDILESCRRATCAEFPECRLHVLCFRRRA